MGKACIILGGSGTGKSRSIKGLDPKETVIINVLNKALPFKGSSQMYNSKNKNLLPVGRDSWESVVKYINTISGKEELQHIKYIVIDDAIYTMVDEFFDRAKEVGYNKFTDIACHFQQIMKACRTARADLRVFIILHEENVVSDGSIVSKKVRTIGKMLDDKYNPLESCEICLCSYVEFSKDGDPEYKFIVNRRVINGAEIPAKSPEGMFDNWSIPNDLSIVAKAIDEYYG